MNIAAFIPNWVGDVVMATPALRALRQHFADARITAVMKPYVAEVLDGAPWFDESLFCDKKGPWSRRWPAVSWRLRRKNIGLAILFQNSFRSALMARLGGCGQRIGYAMHGRSWLLSDVLHPHRDDSGRRIPSPIIDDYNRLAEEAGCPSPGYGMELFTSGKDQSAADAVWQHAGFHTSSEVVCFNPGGAFGSAKHWYADYFAQLAQFLVDRRGCRILVLCGPAERGTARRIGDLARRSQVHTLADTPLSLGLTKECVRRCNLLITTDSGPRHFAAAFDRPVLTLFGPTHIGWTETYFEQAVHLQKKVECGPCQKRVCPLDHRCMRQLTPEEVFLAAVDLLARRPVNRFAIRREAS